MDPSFEGQDAFVASATNVVRQHYAAWEFLNNFSQGHDGSIDKVISSFEVRRESLQSFASEENIQRLTTHLLEAKRRDLHGWFEAVQVAKRDVSRLRSATDSTPLAIAEAEARLKIQQDRLSYGQYEESKRNFRDAAVLIQSCGFIASYFFETEKGSELLRKASLVTQAGAAAYDVCWNIVNYGTAASMAGPLAPTVAVAGGVMTLISLYEKWKGVTPKDPVQEGIRVLLENARADHETLTKMLQGLHGVILEKDQLDARRFSALESQSALRYADLVSRLTILSDRTLDLDKAMKDLVSSIGQEQISRRDSAVESLLNRYVENRESIFASIDPAWAQTKIQKHWSTFCVFATNTALLGTLTGGREAKFDLATPFDRQIAILNQSLGSIVSDVPNPIVWAEGVTRAMEFAYRLPQFSDHPEMKWTEMKAVGGRLKFFIEKIKTTPELLSQEIRKYRSLLIEIETTLITLTGTKPELLSALQDVHEYGRRLADMKTLKEGFRGPLDVIGREVATALQTYNTKKANTQKIRKLKATSLKTLEALRDSDYPKTFSTDPSQEILQLVSLARTVIRENTYMPSITAEVSNALGLLKAMQAEALAKCEWEDRTAHQQSLITQEAYVTNQITALETKFASLYEEKSASAIFKEWLNILDHSEPDYSQKKADWINRIYLAATRESLFARQLDQLSQQKFKLLAIASLAFSDHEEIYYLAKQLWSREEWLSRLDPHEFNICKAMKKTLLPSINALEATLIHESTSPNPSLGNALLDCTFQKIAIFDQFLAIKKESVKALSDNPHAQKRRKKEEDTDSTTPGVWPSFAFFASKQEVAPKPAQPTLKREREA